MRQFTWFSNFAELRFRPMGGLRTLGNTILRLLGLLAARILRPSEPTIGNAGIGVTIIVGVFSLAVIWFGVGYIATEDYKRTEATAYQDTANLARAFEEHIVRLMQAHDQILLFVRASIAK